MTEQNDFLTKSGCFRAKSNIKPARSRFHFGDPGEGAFVGSSGIAKNTELFYSGQIFVGYYDEDKMLQLWKTTFKENLPPSGKIKFIRWNAHSGSSEVPVNGLPFSTATKYILCVML